jgi:hypothetical protein
MQLVAYGAQDIYLTGSPQITFFKTVYRRHTNFAIESIEQQFNGTVGFGKKVSTTISRNGDLITDVILEIVLTRGTVTNKTTYPAEQLISDIELEIGGQRIDKHYSDWFRIYDNLFRKADDRAAYRRMVDFSDEKADSVKRLYLPLIFFFNRSPGLALPLIALQYHEVKLNIQFAAQSVMNGIKNVEPTVQCYVDYVYLDTEERRKFAQVSHEYLIQQVQFTGDESVTPSASATVSTNIRLNFNHPTKFLAWVFKNPSGGHGHYSSLADADYGNVATYNEGLGPLYKAKLQLNGHDRASERTGSYFNIVQPWQTLRSRPSAGIYMYSFSLKPDEHQPSGSCNFSRIDNATLNLTLKKASATAVGESALNIDNEDVMCSNGTKNTQLKIFAENYNVFRIMSGMGGLAYSN